MSLRKDAQFRGEVFADPFERQPLATLTGVEGVDGSITVPAESVAVIDCATEWVKSDTHVDLEGMR
jgi:hypothetical protein